MSEAKFGFVPPRMSLRSCGVRIMILLMRAFIGLQLTFLALALNKVVAPHIGLVENEQFILYGLFGVKRLEAFSPLCLTW